MSFSARNPSFLSVAFLCVSLVTSQAAAETYYVATSGSDANDGTSPEAAWGTVTHAAEQATAGDTVYIKAGLYQDQSLEIRNSGTEGSPIVFQGYQTTPGDAPDPGYTPGEALDSSVLPVLEAVSRELQSTGAGVLIDNQKNYLEVRYLGVVNFNTGVSLGGSDHIVIEDVYAVGRGPVDSGVGQYLGYWVMNCTDVTLRDCVVADAEMQNITFFVTHDSLIENCRSYATVYDPPAKATDYHIVLMYGHSNVVRSCSAENLHWRNGSHQGHGIGIKDDYRGPERGGYPYPHSYGNQFIDCVASEMGEAFFVAHEAYDNEFVNCQAIGHFREYPADNYWSQGINIRDGAHHNTFRSCRISGARGSLNFEDTIEGPTNDDGSPVVQLVSNNTIINSVFSDSAKGIELWNADDNLIANCVFDRVGDWALVRFVTDASFEQRHDVGNTIRNSIVTNVSGECVLVEESTGDDMPFTYSDFWGNSFAMPEGEGNLALDPLFADAAGGDYHLQSQQGRWDAASSAWVEDSQTSPCIDAGDPTDDFSLEPCPRGERINMGAYGNTAEASLGAAGESCSCTAGEERGCYNGPEGTAGVGLCVAGEQACADGTWGACVGQVAPSSEVCADARDNDCDGETDEAEDCTEPTCDGGVCDAGPDGGEDGGEDAAVDGGGDAEDSGCSCGIAGREASPVGVFALLIALWLASSLRRKSRR